MVSCPLECLARFGPLWFVRRHNNMLMLMMPTFVIPTWPQSCRSKRIAAVDSVVLERLWTIWQANPLFCTVKCPFQIKEQGSIVSLQRATWTGPVLFSIFAGHKAMPKLRAPVGAQANVSSQVFLWSGWQWITSSCLLFIISWVCKCVPSAGNIRRHDEDHATNLVASIWTLEPNDSQWSAVTYMPP